MTIAALFGIVLSGRVYLSEAILLIVFYFAFLASFLVTRIIKRYRKRTKEINSTDTTTATTTQTVNNDTNTCDTSNELTLHPNPYVLIFSIRFPYFFFIFLNLSNFQLGYGNQFLTNFIFLFSELL